VLDFWSLKVGKPHFQLIQMGKFQLRSDPKLLSLLPTGSIVGPIVLEMDDVEFPDNHWSDFPIVILGWWLDELASLVMNSVRRGVFRFMDGPFRFEFVKRHESALEENLRLVDERQDLPVLEGVVSLTEVQRQIYRVASDLISKCESNGWNSKDIDQLRRALST
jgi:hypothetical protein